MLDGHYTRRRLGRTTVRSGSGLTGPLVFKSFLTRSFSGSPGIYTRPYWAGLLSEVAVI
jgi:hypothetical protein